MQLRPPFYKAGLVFYLFLFCFRTCTYNGIFNVFFFNFFVVQYWKHLVMQRQFIIIIVAVLENSFYSVLLRLGILLAAKSPTVSFPF